MIIHGARPRSDKDVIATRLGELVEAFATLNAVLHKFDGTQVDSEFGVPEMRQAHMYLETAYLWAKNAVESN